MKIERITQTEPMFQITLSEKDALRLRWLMWFDGSIPRALVDRVDSGADIGNLQRWMEELYAALSENGVPSVVDLNTGMPTRTFPGEGNPRGLPGYCACFGGGRGRLKQ